MDLDPLYCRYNLSPSSPDLGPGAAIHMSSLAEPVGSWLKAGGARESRPVAEGNSIPHEVLTAAKARKVTGRCVWDHVWCVHFCVPRKRHREQIYA